MKVTFVHNATVIIETPDLKILCDPWFTDGAYDGSWYHWPPVEDKIPDVDVVWVSHVHPDHYDPAWLTQYLATHDARLMIADQPLLLAAMLRDGFTPEVIDSVTVGHTELHAVPDCALPLDNIDSALVVKSGSESVVNVNDCAIYPDLAKRLQELAPNPDIALLPFAGAGPWPQTFVGAPKAIMRHAVRDRTDAFLAQFGEWREFLNPHTTVPFAGQYMLGGPNFPLNANRGIPDPLVCGILTRVVVLNSYGTVDTNGVVDGLRTEPLPAPEARKWVPMAWESDTDIPTLDMVAEAVTRAARLVKAPPVTIHTETLEVRVGSFQLGAVHVPDRYLFGLLTGKYQWDSALTGSNVRFSGSGQVASKAFRDFYNRLHV